MPTLTRVIEHMHLMCFEIDYSRDAISAYLGNPFEKDDEPDIYHDRIRNYENPLSSGSHYSGTLHPKAWVDT